MANKKRTIFSWIFVVLLIIGVLLTGKTIAQSSVINNTTQLTTLTVSGIKQFLTDTKMLAQDDSIKVPATAPSTTPSNAPSSDQIVTAPPKGTSTADLNEFLAAIKEIKSYYYEPVTDSSLYESAIRGMLSGLDPHSSYLNAQDLADLHDITTGQFSGVGLEVTPDDGYLRVVSPIDDTPAQKAGILPGDLIVLIDATPVMNISFRDAVKMMRGSKGSALSLTVIRQGQDQPLSFKMIRDDIRVDSVKSKTLEPGYGYIRVSSFQEDTGAQLTKAIADLQAKNNNNLKGVILDLRNNPGGLLDAAISVADAFLDRRTLKYDGLIVYTKGRSPDALYKANADNVDYLHGAPMVVLVNGGSASGAEIVAGALQDHHRAVIMGTNTFGKGSVQTVIPLGENSALKLTTALYYTPAGRSIQAEGIRPDIIVDSLTVSPPKKEQQLLLSFLKESNLKDHLANANVNAGGNTEGENISSNNSSQISSALLASQDYQMAQALNLLKGLNIVDQKSAE